ncbi:MAG: hypothetical protein Q8R12_03110 [bacterium]|nr:hypothetical protein [bacterium]
MIKTFERGLIFLLLLWLGLAAGWEFLLAGAIFFLSLDPARYEYLMLGLGFDAMHFFPAGFFTITLIALTLAARFLARYLEAENISSFLVRLAGLALVGFFITSLYFLAGLPSEILRALGFAASFLIKAAAFSLFLTLFFKILELCNETQTVAP